MASSINSSTGHYWLVYYQPVPEVGEKITVALILQELGRRPRVEFDEDFSKVLKIFPATDPQTLAFYLESIAHQLDLGGPIESAVNAFGPQLVASKSRSMISPVSGEVLQHLRARYLLPAKKQRQLRDRPDGVATEIESYVRGRVAGNLQIRKDVQARDILGESVTGTKRIALAIETEGHWALIDGVDLNQSTPKQATDRADEIARTYWNYGRAAAEKGIRVERVGIVLNGHSHLQAKSLEAHDYALHRFRAESDHAIDAASPGSDVELRNLLEKLVQR